MQTPLTHLQSLHNYRSSYLHNLISVQPPRSSRSSSIVTLGPPTSSLLRTTDRSVRYSSRCLWNQLPSSLRHPHSSPSISDLPVHAPTTSSHVVNSPLSPSITPSLFHSRLKTYLFLKSFPPQTPFRPRTDSTDFITGPFLLRISVFGHHTSHCYHSCSDAESRQSLLEVTHLCTNKAEVV